MGVETYLPWRNGLDVTDAIGKETTENTGAGVAQKPSGVSKRLLGALIPHGDDDGETRCDGSLAYAEEETVGEQATGIEADGGQNKDDAPYKAGSAIASVLVPSSSAPKKEITKIRGGDAGINLH